MPRIAIAAALAVLALAGCGGTSTEGGAPAGSPGGDVRLVAYSTPREAYEKLIDLYTSGSGEGVSFRQSYGSSGEQSRAVEAGLRADVVAFSLEPDMTRLVDEDLVAADWNSGPNKGMVTDSVVVFMVREGNPLGIDSWDDLTKEGVEVITPNPFTSGGARWNVMAGYGAQLELGKSEEQARDYLRELFANVTVQDKSARESLTTFAAGKGDVLLAYENEAIFAERAGAAVRVRRARPDDPDRESRRGDEGRVRGGQGLRRLPAHRRGAEGLRRRGLPARLEGCPRHVRLPAARRRSSRSPISAAGSRSRRSSSTARPASWPRCSASSGSRPTARASARSAPAAAAAGRRRTCVPSAGSRACTPRSRRRDRSRRRAAPATATIAPSAVPAVSQPARYAALAAPRKTTPTRFAKRGGRASSSGPSPNRGCTSSK